MTEDEIIDRTASRSQYRNTLHDKEENRDVVFLVGVEPDVWRIPGHKSVLGKNPVFKAMLEGPLANKETAITTIVIEDVEGKAFDLLLGFLYTAHVELSSINTALATLYAANKYLCGELVRVCIRYLDQNISVQSVLQIYQHSRLYSGTLDFPPDSTTVDLSFCDDDDDKDANKTNSSRLFRRKNDKDKIIDLLKIDDNSRLFDYASNITTKSTSAIDYCSWLLFNCYHFIDENADEVLAHEYVEDLTKDALYDIAKRESLAVSSELRLFLAIDRWSNRECKRRRLELTKENRLQVLGDELLFAVRYLLMDYSDYLQGPLRSGLLDNTRNTILLSRILDDRSTTIVVRDADKDKIAPDLLEILSRERNPRTNTLPVPLSFRSHEYRTFHKRKKTDCAQLKTCRKKKDGSPTAGNNGANKKLKDKRDSRCLDYTLNVLACIFD